MTRVPRATKIVATLGPACSDPAVLQRMIAAGVDVVRLNFSHGTADDHMDRARLVRDIARKIGREIAIMADLQGPKIRVGKFVDGKVTLEVGQRFVLDAECEMGDATRVGLDYKELPHDVTRGNVLLLNDGLIKLVVEQQDRAGADVIDELAVIETHAGGIAALALGVEDETCAGHELDLAVGEFADADLGSLQVSHDRDFAAERARGFAHERCEVHVVPGRAVREVEAHDVDAGGKHAAQHVGLAARRPERGDDLR